MERAKKKTGYFLGSYKFVDFLILGGFGFIGCVYLRTMLPGLGFHDVGELQGVVNSLQIPHPTGFPSYVLVSYLLTILLPNFDPAWKVNFISLLYTLTGLFLFYLTIVLLTKDKIASFISISIAAFSQPIWNYSGMADTHSFGRMMLALLIYIAISMKENFGRFRFSLFCLILGVSLGGHLFIVYALPFLLIFMGYLLFKQRQKLISTQNRFLIAEGIVCFFIGISVYLFLPIRSLIGERILDVSLANWSEFIKYVSGSDFQGLMFSGDLKTIIGNIFLSMVSLYNWLGFGSVILIILGLGVGIYKYRIEAILIIMMGLSLLCFAANYPTSDPSRYFGWVILVLSVLIGFAVSFILNVVKMRIFYVTFICILFLIVALNIKINFNLVDKHNDNSAAIFAREAMDKAEPNAVILSWWNYMTPLRYEKMVLKKRKDVLIINTGMENWISVTDRYIDSRPVYAVLDDEGLREKYNLNYLGSIYKVERRNSFNE